MCLHCVCVIAYTAGCLCICVWVCECVHRHSLPVRLWSISVSCREAGALFTGCGWEACHCSCLVYGPCFGDVLASPGCWCWTCELFVSALWVFVHRYSVVPITCSGDGETRTCSIVRFLVIFGGLYWMSVLIKIQRAAAFLLLIIISSIFKQCDWIKSVSLFSLSLHFLLVSLSALSLFIISSLSLLHRANTECGLEMVLQHIEHKPVVTYHHYFVIQSTTYFKHGVHLLFIFSFLPSSPIFCSSFLSLWIIPILKPAECVSVCFCVCSSGKNQETILLLLLLSTMLLTSPRFSWLWNNDSHIHPELFLYIYLVHFLNFSNSYSCFITYMSPCHQVMTFFSSFLLLSSPHFNVFFLPPYCVSFFSPPLLSFASTAFLFFICHPVLCHFTCSICSSSSLSEFVSFQFSSGSCCDQWLLDFIIVCERF